MATPPLPVTLAAALLLVTALPALGQAIDPPRVDPKVEARAASLWERHWRRFAAKTIAFEDDFAHCPTFDRRFPSSVGQTVDQWRHDNSVRRRVSMGGSLVQTQTLTPPREEGEAAVMLLPKMAVGQYGHIHSVQVVRVLGPREMLVDDLWLVDEQALDAEREKMERELRLKAESDTDARRAVSDRLDISFEQRAAAADRQRDSSFSNQARLIGFPTEGLEPGQRYSGPPARPFQVAVLRAEDQMRRTATTSSSTRTTTSSSSSSSRSRRQQLVLGPTLDFVEGIDETAFRTLLEKRGLTDTQFVQLVIDAHDQAKDDPDAHVFAQLERRRAAMQEAQQAAAQHDEKAQNAPKP